ncbi:MAG: MotA/TolQ/ExbB proton channel family protein [Sneathiella sp.]
MLLEEFSRLGLMGWPLVLCSVLAAMVVFERTVYLLRFRWMKDRHFNALASILKAHEDCSKALRDEAASMMLERLKGRALSGVRFLRILATLSPLLGLLGTILGIVAAFKVIAAQTGPVSPNMIADGLWEAMLTTGFGLMIALPCLFLAYLFQNLAERQLIQFAHDLNHLSLEIEVSKERQERAVSASPADNRGVAA